jgi:DNA (cytosine-5)-methyltransferase 1
MGYHRAGFEVVGVDIKPQPHYPFEFHQTDALEFPLDGFDVIHASPPCQAWVDSANKEKHPDLITPLRPRLLVAGVPYVIENVDTAPLVNPLLLCGTMFGLRIIRHRLFETEPPIYFPPHPCWHWGKVSSGEFAGVYSGIGHRSRRNGCNTVGFFKACMGIDWMEKRSEITQAIPPAYTEYIGRQLMKVLP